MKRYDCLSITRVIVLLSGLFLSSAGLADFWRDEIQVHGFITQDFYHSSDNNVNGNSDDRINPGLTEIGLNISYQVFNQLTLSAQGLYRRAGAGDSGSVRLDYGVADFNLFNYENGRIGIRGGRIKVPYGLYNETRDIAFIKPSILLPQGLYFARSRSLLVSADGGSFYAEHRTDWGDLFFKFNMGIPSGENEELKSIILSPDAPGNFVASPAIVTQLMYEINGGKYVFAVSYLQIKLRYHPSANDLFSSGYTLVRPLLFSAQYNGEKFGMTAEYGYRWNKSKGYELIPDNKSVTESWYIQGSYRFIPEVQGFLRYDTIAMNIDDRSGSRLTNFGLPKHLSYAKDWVVGLRWDITPSLMVRTEYHRIHGTAWLAQADNADRSKTRQDWDLYALQFSFHF